jgi:hypothetical protein
MLLVIPPPAHPAQSAADAESCFVQATNAARSAAGVPGLPLSSLLSEEARAHSQQMANTNTLYHSTIRVQYGSSWTLIGENVGTDNSCDVVQQAFLNSPHHYQNMVNPVWSQFGVGVVFGGSSVWTTVAFVEAGSGPAPAPAAPAPAPAPKPAPTLAPAPAPVRTTPTRVAVPPPVATTLAAPPAPSVVPSASPSPSPTSAPTSSTVTALPHAVPAKLVAATSGKPATAIIGLVVALSLGVGAGGTWVVRSGSKRWRI